jgi:hypothetical protein
MLLIILPATVATAQASAPYFLSGGMRCSSWLNHYDNADEYSDRVLEWMQGYLAGVAFLSENIRANQGGTKAPVVSALETTDTGDWVDMLVDQCEANPQQDIKTAIDWIIVGL